MAFNFFRFFLFYFYKGIIAKVSNEKLERFIRRIRGG